MTEKSEIIADTHSPSLPVNKIHPMVKRAVQIAAAFDPTTSADWVEGAPTTIQSAIDKLAAREKVATGSLTAAQVIAATTAHDILAAPAAGYVNIVKRLDFFLDYAAAFTSGDDVIIQYKTTTAAIATFDKNSLLGTADLAFSLVPTGYATSATVAGFDMTANAAKAIQLKVTSSAFADGTGTVLKYRIIYETVPVLS